MIGGNVSEFIDLLYYGQEIVFLFRGKKYFIQGWWDENRDKTTMVLEEIKEDVFDGYLWEYHSTSMKSCAEAFLSAPIWEGKDFLKIEANVTWVDW